MAKPTDDFIELFRKKRVFPIKKVVGPKRLKEKIGIAPEDFQNHENLLNFILGYLTEILLK